MDIVVGRKINTIKKKMLFSKITVKHKRICRANDLGSGQLRRRLYDLYKLQYLEKKTHQP